MSWISFLIAVIKTGLTATDEAIWTYQFLVNLVAIEHFFYRISWIVFAIAFIGAIVIIVTGALSRAKEVLVSGLAFGCVSLLLLLWPLWEWLTWFLSRQMLSAVSPEGVVDGGKLLINLFAYFIFGWG